MTRKSPPGQLLARRSPAGQVELVGAAAMTLRRAGLVSFSDDKVTR